MKYFYLYILILLLIACGSDDSNSDIEISNSNSITPTTKPDKENENIKTSGINKEVDNSKKSENKEQNSIKKSYQKSNTKYSLPELSDFATNKSDRFFVDFKDIIAGHPFVGSRSPKPHNDAQVYFSNTDQRWLNANQPSDYPPIYAVADGYISIPSKATYNIVEHKNANPPWWHVAYGFTLQIATQNADVVEFMYQMEPYMIPELAGKSKDFYKNFIIVKNGQFVSKGDILGYMYVPSLQEMVGSKLGSSHIAFSLIKQPSTVYIPAIFNQEVVKQFANIYRNPTEGWESKSFGMDWNRARGLPDAMGWMISGSENPFNDNDLGVLLYDGIKDKDLDSKAIVYPEQLGFDAKDILYSEYGWGDTTLDQINISEDWQVLFSGIGGPIKVNFIIKENNSIRESQVFELRPGQNFTLNHKNNFLGSNNEFSISISDPEEWGWSIAFAKSKASYVPSGSTRDIEPLCPPNCPSKP